MSDRCPSLSEHLMTQLVGLHGVLGRSDHRAATGMLADVLGPAGQRSLDEPGQWFSDVADDGTPLEFSLAFDHAKEPTLRLLTEAVGADPGKYANQLAALACLDSWRDRYHLSTERLDRVRDLFLPDDNQGLFSMWLSLVFRSSGLPRVKVYFDPEAQGPHRAGDLVAEGLRRMGLGAAYPTLLAHTGRPDRVGGDRFSFFALDLHEDSASRVKVYVSHRDGTADDAVLAARAVPGVDDDEVREFVAEIGGPGPFDSRPLISSYTFVDGDTDRPSGYSLYIPIRAYVADDAVARRRVGRLLDRYGYDASLLDAAIAVLTDRSLSSGSGLIAHVSLRFGAGVPGVTMYLSSEAYAVAPPRPDAEALVALSDGGGRRRVDA